MILQIVAAFALLVVFVPWLVVGAVSALIYSNVEVTEVQATAARLPAWIAFAILLVLGLPGFGLTLGFGDAGNRPTGASHPVALPPGFGFGGMASVRAAEGVV